MIVAMFSESYLAQDFVELRDALHNESGIAVSGLYVHNDPSISRMPADVRFVYRVSACARDLAGAKVRNDYLTPNSLVVVYDFPLLVERDGDRPFVQVHDFGGVDAIRGVSSDDWETARRIMFGSYINARFDYVFSYQDGPTNEELAKCGIISDTLSVRNWTDVRDYLKVVVC